VASEDVSVEPEYSVSEDVSVVSVEPEYSVSEDVSEVSVVSDVSSGVSISLVVEDVRRARA